MLSSRTSYDKRIDRLLALPRSAKKTLAVMADSSLCVLTVWLAICFRFENWVSLSGYQWLAVVLSVALAIPLLTAFGFYHTVIRYVGRQTVIAALGAIGIYAVIYSAIFTAYGFALVPRTIGILQPLLLLIGLALTRLLANQLLAEQIHSDSKKLPGVLIYGAGISGQQLATSIDARNESKVIAYLDDNISFQKARIGDIPVHSPKDLPELVAQYQIRDVLLAIPSLSRTRRNEIIRLLGRHKVAVRTLPSLSDLAQGKISEAQLRELNIEDLLGRDPVAPIAQLLHKNITGKKVLVTGAGGSIGSELCRQIAQLQPQCLILADISEFALYTIEQELQQTVVIGQCQLHAVLLNVQNLSDVRAIMAQFKPQTVYHAAAYKHVPLVESNPIAGLRNNVYGTLNVAQAALECHVSDMLLISTDKAVRPTNIMGASKRLAEMVLQSLADTNKIAAESTRFCIVRFGNVLGSSGSVVPKFREQIQRGGPITLTHPDVTRYFMTIPEAAQLVLQAGAMQEHHSQGAQIYLLDMGESVKIIDLAKMMVQLSGLTLRDTNHPQGDIALEITGLRPGEKLYEELLVDGNSKSTEHPKINQAFEKFIPIEKTLACLEQLMTPEELITQHDPTAARVRIRAILEPLVQLQPTVD